MKRAKLEIMNGGNAKGRQPIRQPPAQFGRCLNRPEWPRFLYYLVKPISQREDLEMSHTINVTRTTTTVTSTGVFLNTGYFKTIPGILKLFQTILGAVVVALMSQNLGDRRELFMLLISTSFMIATFTLLLSSLLSLYTATTLQKTMFELLYHSFGFILYLAASITLLVTVNQHHYNKYTYDALMAAGIIGLINCALYLISAVFAYRSYVM